MHATETMLRSHPRADARRIHSSAGVIDTLSLCAAACAMCADACLAEDVHVLLLRRCLRLNLECADACVVAARMLSRQA